uniref:N-terminal EF-hand calcium binding protein 3 n=1 Tax=Anas platyrhynchos TaxID=8839 RepID=A0A8B9T385_ANAPL
MCLLPAKAGAVPHREPLPIFHDIFRRADKNDDGKLSFEEFKNYFADGILSSEELWELFSGIDRRHSDNVDTEKLCDYFSAYLGEYRNVLSALETLNSAVLAAMDKTKLLAMARKVNREDGQLPAEQEGRGGPVLLLALPSSLSGVCISVKSPGMLPPEPPSGRIQPQQRLPVQVY